MKIMIKRKTYQIIEKCLIIGVISIILGIIVFFIFSLKEVLNS